MAFAEVFTEKLFKSNRISLPQLITVIFTAGSLVCMTVLGATMIYWSKLKIEQDMNAFMETTVSNLEGSLVYSVWNYDVDSIEKLVGTTLKQEGSPLQAVKIDYGTGPAWVRYNPKLVDPDYARLLETDHIWIRNRELVLNGEKLAKLTIVGSSADRFAEGRYEMYKIAFVFIFCFACLALFIWRLLNHLLLKPLMSFTDALRLAKNANYSAEIEEKLTGELGLIAQEFNDAIKAIALRDEKLKSYAHHLEGELAEGAQLLQDQKLRAENSARLAALGEMSAGIAHEINNPLAIIHAASERLQGLVERSQEQISKNSLNSEVMRIQKMVDRISKIVSSLRFFARDGASDSKRNFELIKVLDEVRSLIGMKLANRGIQFDIDCDPKLQIYGNEVQISQVLVNLVNNSVDAISHQEEKWIRLVGREEDSYATVSVIDSGKGIDPAITKKIFQPFFTTKELGKGTGLGLSIAHGIVKAHGGAIEIDANSSNTKITFSLPKYAIQ